MNTHEELPLDGGNATEDVVRVGDTVRKPWEPTTPAVHELMRTVTAAGIDVPEPLGRDERGRQIQEFVPGRLALHSPPLTLAELARVGTLIRAIHDACEGFAPSAPAPWEPLLPVPGGETELVCHGDLTPWNLILGERWVFIDWDGAAPSTRLWDLAYSAQAFTLNDASADPSDSAARLAALVDGYGADDPLRAALPRLRVLAGAPPEQPFACSRGIGHGRLRLHGGSLVRGDVVVVHAQTVSRAATTKDDGRFSTVARSCTVFIDNVDATKDAPQTHRDAQIAVAHGRALRVSWARG